MDQLFRQWDSLSVFHNQSIDTVYIGGGTPSLLTPKQWRRLSRLWEPFNNISEITTEVNPASFNPEKMEAYRHTGVTRLSMGIQSFQDSIMKKMGRLADQEAQKQAIHWIQQWPGPWSLDLIYGYPGTRPEDWERDLQQAASLEAPHLSIYQLTLEEGSILSQDYPEDEREALLDIQDAGWPGFLESIERKGYQRYEISNFTRNQPSRHNLHYWNMDQWIGLGAGASSFLYHNDHYGHYRFPSNTEQFQKHDFLHYFSDSIYETQILNRNNYLVEWLMMGLRSIQGASLAKAEAQGFDHSFINRLTRSGQNKNWLRLEKEQVIPTPRGMDHHTPMMLDIMNSLEGISD